MTFETLTQSVTAVIKTIEQSTVLAVRSIKSNKFKVEVDNFPKTTKIDGPIEVSNIKEVRSGLTKIEIPIIRLVELVKNFKLPKSFEVSNFPKFPDQVPFPKEFKVSNLGDIKPVTEIKVSNQPTTQLNDMISAVKSVTKAVGELKLNPQINVTPPVAEKIIVPAPSVTLTQKEIDYEKLATTLAEQIPEFDYAKLEAGFKKAFDSFEINFTGGGGGGKYAYMDTSGHPGQALMNKNHQVSTTNEDRWGLNDSEKTGNVTYSGEQDSDGKWIVRKITKVGSAISMRYATMKDNPLVATYTAAWGSKLDLSYDLYDIAFSLE